MTTYKEYAEQQPTIQIDERLYAKEIPTDLVTILESHNGISDDVRNYFDIGDGIQAVVIALDNDVVGLHPQQEVQCQLKCKGPFQTMTLPSASADQ